MLKYLLNSTSGYSHKQFLLPALLPTCGSYFSVSLHVLQFFQIIYFSNSEYWSSLSGTYFCCYLLVFIVTGWIISIMSISSLLYDASMLILRAYSIGMPIVTLGWQWFWQSSLYWLLTWTYLNGWLLYCFWQYTGAWVAPQPHGIKFGLLFRYSFWGHCLTFVWTPRRLYLAVYFPNSLVD